MERATRTLLASLAWLAACRHPTVATPPPARIAASGPSLTQRAIVLAGSTVDLPGYPVAAARIEPPLPEGLRIDERGHLVGTPHAPAAGQLHRLVGTDGSDTAAYLEIVRAPAPQDRFVSPDGSDDTDGTLAHPFHTIARALAAIPPGTTIFLRDGRYAEDVSLHDVRATQTAPIVIRSYPGEHAVLEGALVDVEWTRATDAGAAPDEWVSLKPVPISQDNAANRGVMFDRTPYTRLLTYGRLEDLRSSNEQWSFAGVLPGPHVPKGPQRPWAYFGPGLWHDPDTGYLHLRLSPTNNHVAGLDDYTGPTHPSEMLLGVSYRASTPLSIVRSSFVELHDLDVVGGGEHTVWIEKADHVTLDHVDVLASTIGLSINESSGVRFVHGRLDGGVPPWTFRSDYKDNYKFDLPDGTVSENPLIRKSSRAVLEVAQGNRDIEIGYCEIENAHDAYMAGIHSEFHHCRIRNLNDDALVISHSPEIDDLRVHDNVFERVLSSLSGDGKRPSGNRYVYRNIFDLREPTPGSRPGLKDTVWRWGHVFKGDFTAGPLYFYQNTILLGGLDDQAAVMLFRSLERDGVAAQPRWFLNNVVMVNNEEDDRTMSFVPAESYRQVKRADGRPMLFSDGNVWVRPHPPRAPMFKCLSLSSTPCRRRELASLDAAQTTGFERHSVTITLPPFARLGSISAVMKDDDLRAAPGSSAAVVGVPLPQDLPDSVPRSAIPSTGALPPGADHLRVGVDGHLSY